MLAATTVSCNDWLSVTSSAELQAEKLYETRTGFYEALTGVYMAMGESTTYGGYYMYSINSYAAYPFRIVDQTYLIGDVQKHKYTHQRVKDMFTSMWSSGYNVIANINIILRELDKRRNVIASDVEYSLIKGELLALRAYLHFDIMRMFGVNDWSGENSSKLAVPYSTEYSAVVVPQLTYAETEKLLLKDLHEALECLKETDPIVVEHGDSFQATINADGYWDNRAKHMNYYAAAALAARVYQWKNEYDTAAEYAKEVIDGAFSSNLVSWVDPDAIVKESSDDMKDWNFTTEHIFSLEVTDLYSALRLIYFSGDNTSVYVDDSFVSVIFPTTGSLAGLEDIRGTALQLKYTSLGYTLYKYYGSTSYSVDYRNRIPMSRISEMYYIVAESLIKDGKNEDALRELDKVREHRGITAELSSEIDAADELLKEYHREFIGEDKLFYYLKHINAQSSISETFDLKADALIYPYPDEEINYGRKQEL